MTAFIRQQARSPVSIDAATGHVGRLPGLWKLPHGRVLTIKAGQRGRLRVAQGRVWATFDNASLDCRVRAGDYFLASGDCLPLEPGQPLVVEAFTVGDECPAWFDWEPAVAAHAGYAARLAQPLVDLRLAFGLALSAAGRLARGLAGA